MAKALCPRLVHGTNGPGPGGPRPCRKQHEGHSPGGRLSIYCHHSPLKPVCGLLLKQPGLGGPGAPGLGGGRVPAAASQPPQHSGRGPVPAASCRATLQLPCLLSPAGPSPSRPLDSSLRSEPVTAPLSLWPPRASCHTAVRALSSPQPPRWPATSPLKTAAAAPKMSCLCAGSARQLPSCLLCLALASSSQVLESAWGPRGVPQPCLCSLLPPANHTGHRGFEPRLGARLLGTLLVQASR